ncbi:hypothetical protein LOZ57_004622 [Ophidiomyces ophidiicola]|uniref:uncharacterized protein n=1 Tax=Ophidiomyces ophidiicola TaxID=1387563 RepID=UPI0020C2BEDA|nr:uncharacterized protein LOZ57_004622 [Ophidiomyces ophidiicola]KAI1944949.1 hypothetical protein LOZ57_004622 [Ophidiomyces ophidiicola]KAI2044614.1 hypothetical protein LOZ43_006317 [Ophidiomyces ophidiicola]KAI2084251.1 hypothetical protein LOZ36_004984 [Ophidiomyces ophidiicola]
MARPYRPVKPIPFELRQHCGIYFEEQLHCHALNLLLSLVYSGTAASSAAFIPPPEFLALAATFIVHPSTTTRAKSKEKQQAANLSLQLLSLVNSLVGPIGAKFGIAFTFTHFSTSRSGAKRSIDNFDGASDEIETLNFELAQRGSLWSRAGDFWHIVGWAFNCAVLHPNRWPRWKLLLEFICDMLEADWRDRLQQGKNLKDYGTKAEILRGSIIYKWLETTSSGVSSRDRRIMRAIFADGASNSVNEFREVFHNELKELQKENSFSQKRDVVVNIDEDIYGDYLDRDVDDDEEESDSPPTIGGELPSRPKRQRRARVKNSGAIDVDRNHDLLNMSCSDNIALLGDLECLSLRQRLLAIISAVSAAIPDDFMHIEQLYHLMVEFILPLPLPIFQLFVSPSVLLNFPVDAQVTLCEMLLERLRENKKLFSQGPSVFNQSKLELYLPLTANNADVFDNTRVSILLESAIRLLSINGLLRVTPSFKQALNVGIDARGEKAQSDTKKGQNRLKAEELAWTWLIESGERLAYLTEEVFEEEVEPLRASSALRSKKKIKDDTLGFFHV